MFCPVCGDEYRPGFSRCGDCDVDLTEAPPARAEEPEPIELVTVLETEDQSLATIAMSVLDGAGIPCVAKSQGSGLAWTTVGESLYGRGGPTRLQVHRENAEVARQLLVADPTPPNEDDDA